MLPAPAPSPAPTPVPSTAHTPVGRLRRRRRLIAIGLAACGLVAVAVVGVWFQPQKLFIDRRVDEASPLSIAASQGAAGVRPDGTASAIAASGTALRDEGPSMSSGEAATATTATATATAGAAAQTTAGAAATAGPTAGATPPAPSIRAVGSFTSLAHHTTGEVVVIDQPDGTSIVRFEDLDTTDGPDLRVLLTAAGTAQDPAPGAVELGRLKGNQGSQNYTVPDGTDLTATPQVVIWCARFNVAFGTAVLEPRP